jgi:hypothetical protein
LREPDIFHASHYPTTSKTPTNNEIEDEDEGRLENALVAIIATRNDSLVVGLEQHHVTNSVLNIEESLLDKVPWDVSDWQERIQSRYQNSGCKITELYYRLSKNQKHQKRVTKTF